MYAVMKTGGKQYRVEPGQTLRVEKLEAEEGSTVRFDQILMVGGETATIGAPLVAGAAVEAEVLAQVKGEKVISFVRRRRKHSSKRTRGHRQRLTVLRVTGIQPAEGAEMVVAEAREVEEGPALERGDEAATDEGGLAIEDVPVEDGGRADAPTSAAAPADDGAGEATDAAAADTSLDAEADDAGEAAAEAAGSKPDTLDEPRRGSPDDLTRVKGVGPKLEGILHEIGVFHFDQIAAWGPDEVAYMDARLSFHGRIEREEWVAQAARLADETKE